MWGCPLPLSRFFLLISYLFDFPFGFYLFNSLGVLGVSVFEFVLLSFVLSYDMQVMIALNFKMASSW
jgi:hypothetical protein